MTKFIGMKRIAHPVIVLPGIFLPECIMIYQADHLFTGYVSYYIHVFIEIRLTLRSSLRQYGTCRLQYRNSTETADSTNEKPKIFLEFIWRYISIGTVVHAKHDEDDMRSELSNKNLEIFKSMRRVCPADCRFYDRIQASSHFKSHAFGKKFGIVPQTKSV